MADKPIANTLISSDKNSQKISKNKLGVEFLRNNPSCNQQEDESSIIQLMILVTGIGLRIDQENSKSDAIIGMENSHDK